MGLPDFTNSSADFGSMFWTAGTTSPPARLWSTIDAFLPWVTANCNRNTIFYWKSRFSGVFSFCIFNRKFRESMAIISVRAPPPQCDFRAPRDVSERLLEVAGDEGACRLRWEMMIFPLNDDGFYTKQWWFVCWKRAFSRAESRELLEQLHLHGQRPRAKIRAGRRVWVYTNDIMQCNNIMQ